MPSTESILAILGKPNSPIRPFSNASSVEARLPWRVATVPVALS